MEPPVSAGYDARLGQTVRLTTTQGNRKFTVAHVFEPLSDERYFLFQEHLEQFQRTAKRVSTAMYGPKERLWLDIIESVSGYADKADFKEAVPLQHRIEAIAPVIDVVFADAEPDADDGLFDIEALIKIEFQAMQGDTLYTALSHSFAPESRAQMDEFLAIQANETLPNAIASAVKLSTAEKLVNLGRGLVKETDGYADGSPIPAWHLSATTQTFFLRQIAQAGKL